MEHLLHRLYGVDAPARDHMRCGQQDVHGRETVTSTFPDRDESSARERALPHFAPGTSCHLTPRSSSHCVIQKTS